MTPDQIAVDPAAVLIRPADATRDGAGCAAIYAPYVTDSWASFESEPPTGSEMTRRIAGSIDWLVATTPDDGIVGFAYAAKHRERAAYRWACDTSVYLAPVAQGHGLGRALYAALIERLAARGYRMLCAGVALPNDASVGLHRAVGFVDVGTYRAIGFKDGRWVDTLWLQRPLGGDGPPTREPG